jgi:hypothetical protein
MLEVLAYLRASGFKTYVVSGGGQEFMRAFASEAYGIPPEQIVGSTGKLSYELRDGKPVLRKLPEIDFVDDGPGKPAGIQKFIGRRPVIAFGNSDGDFQMPEWTTSAPGPRLALIVHHTDGEREVAYDRGSHIGKLERGLDEAPKRGWVLIDMKKDWKQVFPPESAMRAVPSFRSSSWRSPAAPGAAPAAANMSAARLILSGSRRTDLHPRMRSSFAGDRLTITSFRRLPPRRQGSSRRGRSG